jgi:hypothetical protein
VPRKHHLLRELMGFLYRVWEGNEQKFFFFFFFFGLLLQSFQKADNHSKSLCGQRDYSIRKKDKLL